jgi:hypothetical protein
MVSFYEMGIYMPVFQKKKKVTKTEGDDISSKRKSTECKNKIDRLEIVKNARHCVPLI